MFDNKKGSRIIEEDKAQKVGSVTSYFHNNLKICFCISLCLAICMLID